MDLSNHAHVISEEKKYMSIYCKQIENDIKRNVDDDSDVIHLTLFAIDLQAEDETK